MTVDKLIEIIGGEVVSDQGVSGVIEHNKEIYSTYYLDSEYKIKSFQIFASAMKSKNLGIQIGHTTTLLNLYLSTIHNLCEIEMDEVKSILKLLGLYNKTFAQGKQVFMYDYMFKVETANGLVLLTISEIE